MDLLQQNTKPFIFLIVISPPKDIVDYANKLKSEFHQEFGPYDGQYSKPHITICNFLLLEERQEKVLSAFQYGLAQIEPFLLELHDFNSFEKSNVIYLAVNDPPGLKSLRKQLSLMSQELWLKKNFSLSDKPHLTIARKLTSRTFALAKSAYQSKSYQNAFLVERLKVLRYDPGKRRYFDIGDLILGS